MDYPKAEFKSTIDTPTTFGVDLKKVVPPVYEKDYVVRRKGEFAGLGLWLDLDYDWKIVRDSKDNLVLLQMKKK